VRRRLGGDNPPTSLSITYTGAYYASKTTLLQEAKMNSTSTHTKIWVATGDVNNGQHPYIASTPATSGNGTPSAFTPLNNVYYNSNKFVKNGSPSAFRITESNNRIDYVPEVKGTVIEGVPPSRYVWTEQVKNKVVVQAVSWACEVSYLLDSAANQPAPTAADPKKEKTDLDANIVDLSLTTPWFHSLLQIGN
jgi:hypothetical protein